MAVNNKINLLVDTEYGTMPQTEEAAKKKAEKDTAGLLASTSSDKKEDEQPAPAPAVAEAEATERISALAESAQRPAQTAASPAPAAQATAPAGGFEAATVQPYQAQNRLVDALYDTQRSAMVSALESEYTKNAQSAQAARDKIPEAYQDAANQATAQAAQNSLAFNEYAAASGLNVGTGSQAKLAQNAVLQGNLTAIRTAEANAISDAEQTLSQLYSSYRSGISQALAENEYQRAAALLAEYQRQAESVVTTAAAQADENYRAQAANQNAKSAASADAEDKAAALGAYGDFSGYAALGYTPAQIASMTAVWNAQNPDAAFGLGRITAEEYARFTGATIAGKKATAESGSAGGPDYYVQGAGYYSEDDLASALQNGTVTVSADTSGNYIYSLASPDNSQYRVEGMGRVSASELKSLLAQGLVKVSTDSNGNLTYTA